MDANVMEQAEELAKSIATQATTMEELNGVMRTLMKSALEQMLGAELKVHLKGERQAAGIAPSLISEITDSLDTEVKAWQSRRLDRVYPLLFLDGIVVHVRSESDQVREHVQGH